MQTWNKRGDYFDLQTSEFASGKNFSNHSVPLNCVMNDGNGVGGGGGGGVGVGSLGGGGVLQSAKERKLWVKKYGVMKLMKFLND